LPRLAEDAERESSPLEAHFADEIGDEPLRLLFVCCHEAAAVLPESVPARYPGWHAVIGELHFRLGRHSAAERAWREALRFTTARADREFLRRRLAVCRPDGGDRFCN
jgi:predicted RNA polymerase sigma factor